MKIIRKSISLLLSVLLLLSAFSGVLLAQARVSYGSCGKFVGYELSESGVLAITLTGTTDCDMNDYTAKSGAPWADYAAKIKKITVGKGVTRIGAYAFSGLASVTEVTMDASVTAIGSNAFAGMTSLARVNYNGTRDGMKAISLGSGNEPFSDAATIYTNEIGTIEVTVTAPKIGDAIKTDGITAPAGLKYTDIYWTKKGAGDVFAKTSDTTFKAGAEYGIYIAVAPQENYSIYSGAKVRVNGETAQFKQEEAKKYALSYHFDVLTAQVKKIEITGISAPKAGESISISGVKIPEGFAPDSIYWTKKGAGDIYAKTTDKTFQHGGEYGFYAALKLQDGYTLASDTTASIGTNEAKLLINPDNICVVSCSFPVVIQTLTVTFDPAGGTVSPTTKSVQRGAKYGELPTPTREGYSFDGWFTAGDQRVGADAYLESAADVTLTAKWTKLPGKKITVTFDPDGGTLADDAKSKIVEVGEAYGELPTPTRPGHTFDGWFSGTTKITDKSEVTQKDDHKLTAKWIKDPPKNVVVTFNAAPGLVNPTSMEVTVGEPYGTLPKPFSSGRTFLGWFNGETAVNAKSIVAETEDHVLTAKWQTQVEPSEKVTVTFHADGGTVTPETKIVEAGKAYGELPVPTKQNSTFLGWYTPDSVKVVDTTVVPYSVDHTLTARWKSDSAKPVTVTLNAGEGATGSETKKLEPGKAYGELPVPQKEGYVFLGWYDGDGKKAESTDLVPTADLTLTAKWELKAAPHTEHTFDAGTVNKESTCKETGQVTYTCLVCGETKTEELPLGAHKFTSKVIREATCAATGAQQNTCAVCGTIVVDVLPKKAHNYQNETTPATLKKSGSVTGICTVCGDAQVMRVIARPKSFSLAAKQYTYNGKAKKPSVTVKDSKGVIIDPEFYTLKYSGNKQVGTAKVKVVFKGDYSGTKTLKFKILPKKTAIKSLTAGTNQFKATWKKISSGDGYQIQYATNKAFDKNLKTITIKDETVAKRTVKKLQSGKTYYVRVRTLQVVDSKNYYALWSKAVKVKTK